MWHTLDKEKVLYELGTELQNQIYVKYQMKVIWYKKIMRLKCKIKVCKEC